MAQEPARRLEDRIRELCTRVTEARNGDFIELTDTLRNTLNQFSQLQLVLDDLIRRKKNKSAAALLSWPEFPRDRRGSHA